MIYWDFFVVIIANGTRSHPLVVPQLVYIITYDVWIARVIFHVSAVDIGEQNPKGI
jgi:hypothetical protein